MIILAALTDTKIYIYVLLGWLSSCFALVAESVSITSSFNVVEENVSCTSSVGEVVGTIVTNSTAPDGDKTNSTPSELALVGVLLDSTIVVVEGDDVIMVTGSSNCNTIVDASISTGDNVGITGESVGIGTGANVCFSIVIVVVGALVIITSSSSTTLLIVTLDVGTIDPSTSIKPHSLSSG
jgi:hypothetical protein